MTDFKRAAIALIVFTVTVSAAQARETITFPSRDGLAITADTYIAHPPSAPFIVLFHQARWSRGEYLEIAPRLNRLGFNAMAIDQRSGESVNRVANETAGRARSMHAGTSYVDAMQDIGAALAYARAHFASGKLIAWGSSYSAALVLRVAGDEPALADGVLAFSPGEYFVKLGKPEDWVRAAAAGIRVPAFIASARDERERWAAIYDAIPASKSFHVPATPGNHGSRALWAKFSDSPGYWRAVEHFLARHFLP